MSQYAQPLKVKNYVAAGNQMHPFERIVVSNHVDIPDTQSIDEDARVVFKAKEAQVSTRRGVSLPWALLLIMLTIAIMGSISLNTAYQSGVLRDEIAQLQNKYTAFEQERLVLDEQLSAARDSNYICYYATQHLGMKLALHEETIQVAAPSTRSNDFSWSAGVGVASGRR